MILSQEFKPTTMKDMGTEMVSNRFDYFTVIHTMTVHHRIVVILFYILFSLSRVQQVCGPLPSNPFTNELSCLPVGRCFCSQAIRRRRARVYLRALDRFSRLGNGYGGEFAFRTTTSRRTSSVAHKVWPRKRVCPTSWARNIKLLLSLRDINFPSRSSV